MTKKVIGTTVCVVKIIKDMIYQYVFPTKGKILLLLLVFTFDSHSVRDFTLNNIAIKILYHL